MLKIALTGGIAAGKSEIRSFFREQGLPTIDADAIVAGLYTNETVKKQILSLFHTLDRKEIAEQIFPFPEKRKKLEELLHPLVIQEIEGQMKKLQSDGKKIVIVEIPLLFEAGLEGFFDKVIAVTCSREQQLARLKKQGLSQGQAMQRINSQLPREEKVKKADFTIDNGGSLAEAREQAEKILRRLNG